MHRIGIPRYNQSYTTLTDYIWGFLIKMLHCGNVVDMPYCKCISICLMIIRFLITLLLKALRLIGIRHHVSFSMFVLFISSFA